MSPEVVKVLGQIYVQIVSSWQSSLSSGSGDLEAIKHEMHTSMLAVKIIRRLLIAGYEFPHREPEVHELWQLGVAQVGSFIGIIFSNPTGLPQEIIRLVEKHSLQLSKLHLEMAKTHPAAFVLLPNSLDLVRSYWGLVKQHGETFGSRTPVTNTAIGSGGDQSDPRTYQEKISLKGLLIIRACIKMVFNPTQTFKYRHPQEKEEKNQATRAVKEELLTQAFVQELMEVVVTKFFVFRESDLREWEEEPEEWEHSMESEGEGYEFSMRPCAEKVFLDISINYRDIVVEPLLAVFNQVASKSNTSLFRS